MTAAECCFVCDGPTPCATHGDPGPIKTVPRREVPNVTAVIWFTVLLLVAMTFMALLLRMPTR